MNSSRQIIEERLGRVEFVALVSMIMAVTAIAVDMMLPAFPDMRADFGLAPDSNDLAVVITMFLIGFGIGQPLWGPLADALGRRTILWIGLAIYIISALASTLAPTLTVLFVLRFSAGFGAAGLRVVALGAVRDAYEGEHMAKVLSYIMAVFILVPVIAPSVGAVVLTVGSWESVFLIIAMFGIVVGIWATRLPETLPPERRIPLDPVRLGSAIVTVARNRFSMGLTVARAAVFGFFASYLASSQIIIDDVFGLQDWFPVIFGASAAVIGAGMLANTRLLDRLPLRTLVRYVMTGYLAATTAFAAIALATGGTPPFWLFLAGLVPILLMHSFVIPNLNAAAMIPMGNIAGTAAAVIGAVASLGGALLGAVIDRLYNGTIIPFATAGVILCAIGFLVYRWADAVWGESTREQVKLPA